MFSPFLMYSGQGDGFDWKTGYFKAPKYGIFHFLYEVTSFGRGDNVTSVDFYKNDAPVINPLSSIFQDAENKMSHEVTLKLKVGDSICLKAKNKNHNSSFSSKPTFLMESVTGYLLKATPF